MNLLSQLTLFQEENLLKLFSQIHNYIYSNDGLSPQQTLEEIVKILFIKIFAENSNYDHLFYISDQELTNLNHDQKNLDFLQNLNHLFTQTKQIYPDLFENNEQIRLSLITLGFIVHQLQNIKFLDNRQDAKGLAFQKFLSHQEKDGRGQFFTPDPIINFCVEMLQPKLNQTIIDPACGSGGFLISAFNYLKNNYTKVNIQDIINNLYGIDINKNIARIAKMKLLLEVNVNNNIFCFNTLEKLENLLKLQPQGFDLVLTNPPFGTVGKIKNNQILQQFDLGYKWLKIGDQYQKSNQIINSQTVEILFIETCLKLLKEGGKMAIVLPNGILENPSLAYLRFYLKQKAKILAIINLPQETFIPFGTGIKTSLLFLEKETFKKNNNYQIFFSKIKKIGYQGNKNATPIYQKNESGQIIKDSTGKAIIDQDFSLVIDDYYRFLETKTLKNNNSFNLNFTELNSRFDYDFYSPENRILITNNGQKSVKLSEICQIIKTKSNQLKNPNLMVKYIELSDINTSNFEIINSTNYLVHQLPSRASYELKTGDLIIAIAGNSVGTKKQATALVTSEFNGAICSNGLRILRNFTIDIYFILYFFKTDQFLKQMFKYRTGSAIPNICDHDLNNIIIYLPNDDKIKEISQKMKRVFELRNLAKEELNNINY